MCGCLMWNDFRVFFVWFFAFYFPINKEDERKNKVKNLKVKCHRKYSLKSSCCSTLVSQYTTTKMQTFVMNIEHWINWSFKVSFSSSKWKIFELRKFYEKKKTHKIKLKNKRIFFSKLNCTYVCICIMTYCMLGDFI